MPVDKAEMAANYGWALSFLKSNKELWKLFNVAVDKNYSVNRFVAALRNTKWFKQHGESWRQTQVLQKTDPGTYNQRLATTRAKVVDFAVSMGSDMSSSQIATVTKNALWFGWDDAQLRNTLSNYLDQMGDSGHYGGEAGRAEAELRTYASNQGITLADSSLKDWLRNIIAQNQTLEDYKAYIQGQAEHSFPSLADDIRGGLTVKELANPYVQQMAQTLELNDQSIGLDDPTIRKALQQTDDKGKPAMVPLWKFEKTLKEDPRWMQTNNARSSLVGTAQSVLRDFGFHYG